MFCLRTSQMKRNIFSSYPNFENQTGINTRPFQEKQIAYVLLLYKLLLNVSKIQNLYLRIYTSPCVSDLKLEIQLQNISFLFSCSQESTWLISRIRWLLTGWKRGFEFRQIYGHVVHLVCCYVAVLQRVDQMSKGVLPRVMC